MEVIQELNKYINEFSIYINKLDDDNKKTITYHLWGNTSEIHINNEYHNEYIINGYYHCETNSLTITKKINFYKWFFTHKSIVMFYRKLKLKQKKRIKRKKYKQNKKIKQKDEEYEIL